MGTKVTEAPLGNPNGSSFTTDLNNQMGVLADEFDKVVYTDGSQSMQGDLNMNSNRLLNLPAPQNNTEPLRLADVEALSGNVIITDNSVTNNITQGGETVTFSNGPRVVPLTYAAALTAAQDLSDMEGYAAVAGTTGGAGKPVYWISDDSDDITRVGSVRWAIEQARAGGGGLCIVSPYGDYHVRLTATLFIPDNTTLSAPARNLHFYVPGDFTGLDCRKKNWILDKFSMERIGSQTSTPQIDLISVQTRTSGGDEADKFYIRQLTLRNASDGAIDVASSLLTTTQCRGTIMETHFVDCGKTMFIGDTFCTTTGAAWCDLALDETPTILVTVKYPHYDCCAQRQPRVGTHAFVHQINGLHTIVPHNTDDGTVASGMGAYVVLGGKFRSENDYFRAGYGSGYIGVNPESAALTPAGGGAGAQFGPGAAVVVGSQSEDGITMNQLNTAKVPTVPYSYTVEAIPAGVGPLATYLRSIEARAGAEIDTAPQGQYTELSALGSFYPTGTSVVYRDDKYYARVDGPAVQVPQARETPTPFLLLPRGSTVTAATDIITVPANQNHISVAPESGTTDNLVTINGGTNGQILLLRSDATANTITVKSTGNIRLDSDCDIGANTYLVLVYDSTASLWKELARTKKAKLPKSTWTADTGTAKRTANATYSATAEVAYTQATIQTLMNEVRDLSQTIKAMKDDLIV